MTAIVGPRGSAVLCLEAEQHWPSGRSMAPGRRPSVVTAGADVRHADKKKVLDMTAIATPAPLTAAPGRDRDIRLVALAGGIGAGAAGLWLLLANPLSDAETGTEITQLLAASSVPLQAMSIVAVFASAALIPAALHLGAVVGGVAGKVTAVAGALTAVLLAAYISSFAAGALIATMLVQSPSAGIGEAALVIANVTELARYGPSLALTAAVAIARSRVNRATWIPALVLALMIAFPLTTWMTAIIVPAWFGIAAATVRTRTESS